VSHGEPHLKLETYDFILKQIIALFVYTKGQDDWIQMLMSWEGIAIQEVIT
jgi:hypothetical protein